MTIRNTIVSAAKSKSFATKLSFFIMGTKNFAMKQVVKGCWFLGVELAFLLFMLTRGIQGIKNLVTLGTESQSFQFNQELG